MTLQFDEFLLHRFFSTLKLKTLTPTLRIFTKSHPLHKHKQCRFFPQVSDSDFKVLDGIVKKISKEKQPFERLEMKKSDLLEMFSYNQFKVRILNEKVKTETTTVYKCGSLIDLCRGPHVRHTGKIKAMEITKNSATYWEGNAEAESLQRIYGISFPDNKQLKEWRQFQEEAAKR